MYSIEQRDEQLLGTSASIRYRLSFENAANHIADVTMEIDDPGEEMVLALPNWIPGSYKVRDFVAFQGDLVVTDGEGKRLATEWIAKNRIRVSSEHAPLVRVAYTYYANERTVRLSHVNRFHAFINPANCLMMVEGRTGEIHHVEIDHPWSTVSTALSPVRERHWGALNYDILIDSPIEIGDHFTASFELHGATHEVGITGAGDFDPTWIVDRCRTIVDQGHRMWRSYPYDRYLFIIQLLPGQYGGLEHARSSVNMFDSDVFGDRAKVGKLLSLLCHEYFHLWNVKRIRPVELGPFDYNAENYTSMLWLAEGVTSYYDNLMVHRCGFTTRDEYLKSMSDDNLSRLLDVPGRRAMSIKESSFLSWVKLYVPTPDSSNRFPSYYLKGGVIFLLVDLYIIDRSNGERSLDDGMRALMDRYVADPSRGVTEDEFITIVGEATGVDIGEPLRRWLNSTDELPVEEMVATVGLEWRRRSEEAQSSGDDMEAHPGVPERWLGMEVEDGKGGTRVSRVWRDAPAARAGIAVDDEIVAVDGMRAHDAKRFGTLLRRARDREHVEILAASEGRLYTTTVRFEPRLPHTLVPLENVSEGQQRRLDLWLGRRVHDEVAV